jgi:hypothetical protein
MRGKIRITVLLGALAAFLILAAGCNLTVERVEVGPLETKTETIEGSGVESVRASIIMGVGELKIGGGANNLLEATFDYNVSQWEPEVEYSFSDGSGRLTVKQPSQEDNTVSIPEKNVRYEWDLRFNEDVPLELYITLGAGDGELELANLALNSFTYEGGAGDVEIDLHGSTVSDLEVTMGAGNVEVDLSGNWSQNLKANITGGVGQATIYLPSGIGVRIEARSGLGVVNASGLNKDGQIYTNDAYGKSEVTLDIEVKGGVGEINLEIRG